MEAILKNKKKTISQIMFVLTLVLLGAAMLLYLFNIFKWSHIPDFGFGFRTATGIDVVGIVTERGQQAGLRVGDRILSVNGMDFADIRQFRSAMKRELEESNTYLLKRNGNQLRVTVVNAPSGLKGSFQKSGLPFLLGLCYALTGTLVFLMKPHERTSWIFFIFAGTFGLFFVFLYKTSVTWPAWLENVSIFTYAFTPAALVHLAFNFPRERRIVKKHPHAQLLPYVASAILFFSVRSVTLTMWDIPFIWLIVVIVYLAFSILFFLGSSFQLWLTSTSEIVKLRSKMILLGSAISASLPLVDFVINTLFHVYIVPSFNYYLPFFLAFPIFVGYSIVKHDLFAIDAVIKRTYGYVLTTGAIAGAYGLFVLLSNIVFGGFEFARSPSFPLLFILGVVFFFNPIRNRVQKFIDRVFYRLEYDYKATVQQISETMRTLMGLKEIGESILGTALGEMSIDSGGVMLLNRQEQRYGYLARAGERKKGQWDRVGGESSKAKTSESGIERTSSASELDFPADNPFIRKLSERKKEVTTYDIQEDPFFSDEKESCREAFYLMEATLVLPLVYEDDLIGLISLGQKKSGKFYRREDINLLITLANQGAVAIENALLMEEVIEKERMEEELAIGRELQMSMLPSECPQVEGIEIAAFSMPAMEVGGDFYDFIEMGNDRVGIVVGDVTGKGVSGALVMSSSRSVFRMLSDEDLTVDEIMLRANGRIKRDIKSGMFVALLYVILNARERILRLCSAGQTQPIYLCAETGKVSLVETEGDSFPLGILDEVDYRETRILLTPGDRIILYTDGIVEAMNESQEMFGFDRLLRVVQGAGTMAAESILKDIVGRVNAFSGTAGQHDDLTVIVLSVNG